MSGSRSVLELCVSLDSSASGFRWRRPADSFDGSCFLLQRQEDVLMMLAFASQCFRAGRPASLSVWDVRPLWRSGTLWRSGLAVIRREEGSAAPSDQRPQPQRGPNPGLRPFVCRRLVYWSVSNFPITGQRSAALLLWLSCQHFLEQSQLSLRACLHGSPDKR